MAPMKRQRAEFDDDQAEVIDVESAQSELLQLERKKPRISYNHSDDATSSQSSDDTSSDEGDFLEQATQFASQQRSKVRRQNEAADNGIIVSVTCKNFMCHGHLKIELGPLINFIIGHNGSGKSAVLTAITLCLGGKASSTSRGQSLKSFIKEGQESATLIVEIKNEGESAYQHDVYGDCIIVERHFSRSGSSAFKLKSSSERIISTRRADLDDICDYFALQIDNPMNVLTQDMARQFLNSSSAQEKYKFFMKGTQLEHLDGDYLVVEQNLDTIDTELCKKQQDCDVFKERARKAQELLALSEKQEELRDKIEHFRGQMAWVQVEEEEKKLREADRHLRRSDETIERLEMTATGLSEAFSQNEQAVDQARRAYEDAKDAEQPLREEMAGVKREADSIKSEQTALQTQQRGVSGELKAAKTRIASAQNDIAEEHRRLSEMDGGKNDERREEIERKKEEASQARDNHRLHSDELHSLEVAKREADIERDKAEENFRKQQATVKEAEDRLNNLIKDRGKLQGAYNPNLPRLLNRLQQENGFREQPVGPLGKHVRLTSPAWSSILEKSFGSNLEAFVVTSKEDQMRLSGLMQQTSCSSPILISRKEPIDTRGHEPDPTFETCLRVLEFDNDLARNSLIIGQSIDQTILIGRREEAIAKMNEGRIVNVKQCFSHNKKPGTGIRFGFAVGGGLSENYVPDYKGLPRMKTDIEYQINSQKQVIEDLKKEQANLKRMQQEKSHQLLRCKQAIEKHKRISQEKLRAAQQAQSVVEDLQDALDQDAIEEGRLDSLKLTLSEAEADKSTYEDSYGECVNARDALRDSLSSITSRLKRFEETIREAEAKSLKAEHKFNQRSGERRAALQEKNNALEALDKAKRNKEESLRERHDQLERVEEFTVQASAVSVRVAVEEGESEESLNMKYQKLETDLKNAERRTGNRSDIARNVYAAVQAMDQANADVESNETLAQLLKTTLVNRRERWRKFQKLITCRARIQFFYLLSERGFTGRLSAHHKQKTLDLLVEPDETRKGSNGRTTHGLSGGEKSFSTICLLLSMWEAMGAPIRCLDEFDVFMDSVNREISMRMMIQFARDSPGKQFILISPQSTDKKLPDRDVKLVKMRDPERGQQTLDFAGGS